MTPQLKAAREHIVSLVHLYAPVHQAVSADAKHKLEAAMDALQAAAVAGLQAPTPPAPLPAGSAPPPAVTPDSAPVGDTGDNSFESPPVAAAPPQGRRTRPQGKPAVPAVTPPVPQREPTNETDATDAPL